MPVDPQAAMSASSEPSPCSWTEKDVMLYALGLGVGADKPPTDPAVLRYTYEKDLKVIPTFGVIPTFTALGSLGDTPGLDLDLMMILHGEQYLEILCDEMPTAAEAETTSRVKAVYDKGKGALIVIETLTSAKDGTPLFKNEYGIFARGEGGFGGESGPPAGNEAPDREPDISHEIPTMAHQAVIYRLSGDRNPLHIDPDFAGMAGFDRPILHGLCTFGNVGRAVIDTVCQGDPTRFGSIKVRFAAPVMPGETIVTDIWKESDTEMVLRARVKERGVDVVKNARATIR